MVLEIIGKNVHLIHTVHFLSNMMKFYNLQLGSSNVKLILLLYYLYIYRKIFKIFVYQIIASPTTRTKRMLEIVIKIQQIIRNFMELLTIVDLSSFTFTTENEVKFDSASFCNDRRGIEERSNCISKLSFRHIE